MKSTLTILTFNEAECVKALFDRIPFSSVDECLIIDGGSTDGTIEFFKDKGLKVIAQDKKGRGEAFRIAVKESQGECMVFFSPDGNEDPKDIPKLIDLLKHCDMAIASRFLEGARNEEDNLLFPWRAWANRVFTLLANIAWNRDGYITDTINGFRAVTKEAFNKLKVDADGYVIEYQMSIRAMKLGLKVKEIPTIEHERIHGKTKARSLPTGILFLRYFVKEFLKRR